MQNTILKMLIGTILPALTPVLKQMLETTVAEFYKFARQTDNALDDMVAEMLLHLLDLPRPETGRTKNPDQPVKALDPQA